MTAEHASLPTPAATRPALVQALRCVARLVPLVILVQAFFAGRGLFLDNDLIDVHGGLGNLTLLLVIVQLALGYSGRDGGQAAAWHVPNGVLVFGLSLGVNARIDRSRRESAAP